MRKSIPFYLIAACLILLPFMASGCGLLFKQLKVTVTDVEASAPGAGDYDMEFNILARHQKGEMGVCYEQTCPHTSIREGFPGTGKLFHFVDKSFTVPIRLEGQEDITHIDIAGYGHIEPSGNAHNRIQFQERILKTITLDSIPFYTLRYKRTVGAKLSKGGNNINLRIKIEGVR